MHESRWRARLRLAHRDDAVVAFGAALVEDADRTGHVCAVGLDEVLCARQGRSQTQAWKVVEATLLRVHMKGQLNDPLRVGSIEPPGAAVGSPDAPTYRG